MIRELEEAERDEDRGGDEKDGDSKKRRAGTEKEGREVSQWEMPIHRSVRDTLLLPVEPDLDETYKTRNPHSHKKKKNRLQDAYELAALEPLREPVTK